MRSVIDRHFDYRDNIPQCKFFSRVKSIVNQPWKRSPPVTEMPVYQKHFCPYSFLITNISNSSIWRILSSTQSKMPSAHIYESEIWFHLRSSRPPISRNKPLLWDFCVAYFMYEDCSIHVATTDVNFFVVFNRLLSAKLHNCVWLILMRKIHSRDLTQLYSLICCTQGSTNSNFAFEPSRLIVELFWVNKNETACWLWIFHFGW